MSTFQYAVELEMRRDRDEREQVAAATAAAARCSRASDVLAIYHGALTITSA